jgi:hypothetical protein
MSDRDYDILVPPGNGSVVVKGWTRGISHYEDEAGKAGALGELGANTIAQLAQMAKMLTGEWVVVLAQSFQLKMPSCPPPSVLTSAVV